MPNVCVVVAFSAFVWAWPPPPSAAPKGAEVAELIGLAPVVDSQDARYRRIRVVGRMNDNGPIHITFNACYRAPDRFALFLTDADEGLPLAYLVDKKLIVYDAVRGELLYLSEARFDYLLRCEAGLFHHVMDIAKSESASHVFLDVRSLFDRKAIGESLARSATKVVQIRRSYEGGTRLVATVDRSRPCPFQRIEIGDQTTKHPVVLIRDLSVNEDVVNPWPAFPPRDRLAGIAKLVDRSRETLLNNLAVMATMTRCFHARLAVRNRGLRGAYEARFGDTVDWARVEERDRTASLALLRVLREYWGEAAKRGRR